MTALAVGSPQASAATLYAPTTAVSVIQRGTDTALGACNFLVKGPSTDPSSNPYRVEGNATIESTRVVASTSIVCYLRRAAYPFSQVGSKLQAALPSNTAVVAGAIEVNTFANLQICTVVDATFSDNSHLNPTGRPDCRALTGVV